ncbi:MAG TPA: hypothetical protein VHS03_07285 [Gaiellaceae bacterium]|nr:hypothetical protein [Gaiellaceae bacterium]
MNTGDVLRDAWHVYVLLFRRSIVVAGVVYLAVAAIEVTNGTAATVVGGLANLGGPVLVQGALVLIVANVHEGQPPAEIAELGRRAGRRFLSLLGASIIYAFGTVFGLIALVYPGLLVASRWSLMAPAIMMEGETTFGALDTSRALVRGESTELCDQTWNVLGVVVVAFLIAELAYWVVIGPIFGFMFPTCGSLSVRLSAHSSRRSRPTCSASSTTG